MIIQKSVYLNTVEPALLNARVPLGLEAKFDVTFFAQDGSAFNQDLAAQLQLTGRTGQQTVTYPMPATDVVNGKTRAVIPADTLTDSNGYRLRLTGTVRGEPALLALGTIYPLAAAGPSAVPDDTIDSVDLSFDRDEPVSLDIRLWADTGKTTPLDISGKTVTANVYDSRGGLMLMPFTVVAIDASTVQLTLTADQVNALPASCWWSLVVADSNGSTTLAEGTVTVLGTAAPSLPTTVANYNYVKPATNDNPLAGQIVHSSITQNTLRVSLTDNGGADLSALFVLLKPGDNVIIGATTWIVRQSTLDVGGWYNLLVTPVAQDASSGVVPVTFQRP